MNDILHALLFIGLAGAVFLGVIAAEAYYWHRKGRPEMYSFKETITNLTMGANYKIVDGIAVALFIRVFFDWVYQFGFQYQPVHGLWSILLIFLVVDASFYLCHFMMHKVRWFWTSHVTHHSAERMNYSTALRQNFTMVFNGAWMFWWVPVALVGFDKNWVTLAIELNLAYQFFLHTETKSPLDKLGAVFNTPSHHRVHHGSNPAQIDTNFGGVLIIWDKIFGTFVPEEKAGVIKYGLTERQPHSLNPIYLQVHEWGEMFRDFRDSGYDFRVFVKGPGWKSDKMMRKEQMASVSKAV